jgi:hypothetical protein
VLLLNECLFLSEYISLSTQSGNVWIHPVHSSLIGFKRRASKGKRTEVSTSRTADSCNILQSRTKFLKEITWTKRIYRIKKNINKLYLLPPTTRISFQDYLGLNCFSSFQEYLISIIRLRSIVYEVYQYVFFPWTTIQNGFRQSLF